MDSAKEQKAIERLKAFEPADGYYLAYSGGKDSDCIKILAQLSGVKFEAVHNLTTVDAPETVRYVQSQPDVRIDKSFDKNGNHVTMVSMSSLNSATSSPKFLAKVSLITSLQEFFTATMALMLSAIS